MGVIIDSHLTWKLHIDHISSKIAKNIGIIIKARRIFDKETLHTLYHSFIFPYLNYCIHLWGSTYHSYISKLEVLQKRIIRIIAGVNRREHTKPLFSDLRIITVNNLYSYCVGLFMYKYYHDQLPEVLNIFTKNSEIHGYDTRQADHLQIPYFSSGIGNMSFKFQAVRIWNKILTFLKVKIKIGTFKKHLKTFLLKNGIDNTT